MNYWTDKSARAEKAKEHTRQMGEKYPLEIAEAVRNTAVYSGTMQKQNQAESNYIIEKSDSVKAIFDHRTGKIAVLNFASYKNPGGMFMKGSSAQEESLCHASFLYNVISDPQLAGYCELPRT